MWWSRVVGLRSMRIVTTKTRRHQEDVQDQERVPNHGSNGTPPGGHGMGENSSCTRSSAAHCARGPDGRNGRMKEPLSRPPVPPVGGGCWRQPPGSSQRLPRPCDGLVSWWSCPRWISPSDSGPLVDSGHLGGKVRLEVEAVSRPRQVRLIGDLGFGSREARLGTPREARIARRREMWRREGADVDPLLQELPAPQIAPRSRFAAARRFPAGPLTDGAIRDATRAAHGAGSRSRRWLPDGSQVRQ